MFKDILESKNISQQKLADKIGVGQQAVSKWANGQRTPSVDTMVKIADALGISWKTVADSFIKK